ncbi:MAG: hypothetical protein KDB14_09775 [Planctomycetales bacterium]|nr:hypothetical protein [Planctomycetales bacterium]
MLGSIASSADPPFAPGARVEVEWFGKMYPGEVTRVTGTGWPFVKFTDDRGRQTEHLFPTNRVRLVTGAANMDRIKKPRKWTSADGSFSVTAALDQVMSTKVRLKREDGSVITVPVAQLSDTDRSFVSLAQKSLGIDPNAPDAPEPPATATNPNAATNPAAGGDGDPLAALPVGNAGNVSMISLASNASGPFTPDVAQPVTTFPALRLPRRVNAKDKNTFHDRTTVRLSHTMRTLAVGASNVFADEGKGGVSLLHIPTQREVAVGEIRKDTTVLAVSDRGDEVVITTAWPTSHVDAIQVLTAKEGKLVPTGGWRSGAQRQIGLRYATFLPDRKLLLVGGTYAVVWDFDTATAERSFELRDGTNPTLSANRRYLACYGKDDHVYVIDVATWQPVRAMPISGTLYTALAFSDDGRRLAAGATQEATIWDIDSGQVVANLATLHASSMARIRFTSHDDFVILGDGNLMHLPSGASVWKYELPKWSQPMPGGLQLAMDWSGDGGQFKLVKAPHAAPLAEADGLTRDQLVFVEPGPVKLTLGSVLANQQTVRQNLEKRVKDAGFQLSQDGGHLVIEIDSKREAQQTENVRDFFSGPFPTDKITFTPVTITAKVTYRGISIYNSTRHITVPNPIRLKQGENVQQAANRYCTPEVSDYTNVFVPRKGPLLPNGKQNFGTSKLFDAS